LQWKIVAVIVNVLFGNPQSFLVGKLSNIVENAAMAIFKVVSSILNSILGLNSYLIIDAGCHQLFHPTPSPPA